MGNDKHFNFQKLTPTDSADISGYKEALDYVFQNDNNDIKNIALSGMYGSGKTSVINSYATQNDKKFINVSIAHFTSLEQEDKKVSDIEKKIVNCLVQQIPDKQVPDSKYHIKRDLKNRSITLTALFIGIIAYVLFWANRLSVEENLEQYFDVAIVLGIINWGGILLFLVAAFSVIFLSYSIFRWLGRGNLISKIKFRGDEIELKEEGISYFDRHLDEILYLLVNAKCDGFVFEDLDRFSDSKVELFEHLRELNELANVRKKRLEDEKKNKDQKNKRLKNKINKDTELCNLEPIRFFYLVGDEILTAGERTKFFDFIIPVIPVVNSSNSYSQLKRGLIDTGWLIKDKEKDKNNNEEKDKNNNEEKDADRFLRGLSLYIDDMRLVRNIINEYQLYAHKVTGVDFDLKQLLALVTYKNIFPEDFVNLQIDKGYLYTVLSKKNDIRKKIIDNIDEEITELSIAIQEPLDELKELEAIKSDRQNNIYTNKYSINFEKWNKEVYPLRKKAIDKKLSNHALKNDLEGKKREKLHVNSKMLYQLIDDSNRENLYKVTINNVRLKDISQYSLIRFLVEGGYVNEETYKDCISFFDEDKISKNDKNFLIAVNSHYSVEPQKKIDNLDLVIDRLTASDFLNISTKNYDLIDFILRYRKQDCIESFILQLKENNDLKFVEDFFGVSKHCDEFIKNIVLNWEGALGLFIESIYSQKENDMKPDAVQQIISSAIICSSDELIMKQNIDNELTQYLSEDIEAFNCEEENISKVVSSFIALGVKLGNIGNQISGEKLFDEIYKSNLYILNLENIMTILEKKYYINSNVNCSNVLTLVFSDKKQPLYDYVKANIEAIVELILDNTEIIEDDEQTSLEVLNSDMAENVAKRYIQAMVYRLTNINELKDDLWIFIISELGVEATCNNVLSFFQRRGLTSDLIIFINKLLDELDFQDNNDKSMIEDFWKMAYRNNAFSTKAYMKICNSMGIIINNFNVSGLSDEKIRCLLELKLIQMDGNGLSTFRKNYPNQVVDYICCDVDRYIQLIQPGFFNIDEIIGVLNSSIVETEMKIGLLKRANPKTVPLKDTNYDEKLTLYIMKNHFDQTELQYLLEKYESYSSIVRDEIYTRVKSSNNVILSNAIVPETFFERFFGDDNVSQTNKINVFDSILDKIDKSEASKLLTLAGKNNLAKIFQDGKRLTALPYDSNDEKLLKVLKSHGIIEDYEIIDSKFKIKKAKNNND